MRRMLLIIRLRWAYIIIVTISQIRQEHIPINRVSTLTYRIITWTKARSVVLLLRIKIIKSTIRSIWLIHLRLSILSIRWLSHWVVLLLLSMLRDLLRGKLVIVNVVIDVVTYEELLRLIRHIYHRLLLLLLLILLLHRRLLLIFSILLGKHRH